MTGGASATFRQRAVLVHDAVAKRLAEKPEPTLAPEVYLPEAIPGGVESLHEEGVVVGSCIDVRHAPAVHDDFGRLVETVEFVDLVGLHRKHRQDQQRNDDRLPGSYVFNYAMN